MNSEPRSTRIVLGYPRIDLEVMTDDVIPDLIAAGFDAGVQLGQLLDADSIALRLGGPIRFVVVGAPAYLEAHGTPRPAGSAGSRVHRAARGP